MPTRKSWILKLDYFALLRGILILIIFFSLIWKVGSYFQSPSKVIAGTPSRVQAWAGTPSPVPTPVIAPVDHGTPPPNVSAKNIFVMDHNSGLVMYSKNADDQIYPASTTKMMTAIVAYENYQLDQPVTIQSAYPEGSNIGLVPGEKVTVGNLLYALLIQSANDAAEDLADAYPTGKTGFILAMNAKAGRLHLSHTHFLNPTGLDQDGHYSSASDLAHLADYLLGFPYLAKIVATENAVISTTDYSVSKPLANVNQLLGRVKGVLGVKTGFTDKAGESLITMVNRDNHEVIIALLGSTDRFTDTTHIIDWIYSNFTWTSKSLSSSGR